MSSPSVVTFDLEPSAVSIVHSLLAGLVIEEAPLNVDELMNERDENTPLLIVGPPPADLSPLEIAQTLRGTYPRAQIIMVTSKSVAHSKKDLIKNGFNDVYYLPFDIASLEFDLNLFKSVMNQMGLVLVPVRTNDLIDLTELEVTTYIYLPANDRYVVFSSPNDLSAHKKQKLLEHNVSTLHVEQKNLPTFYEAFAKAVKLTQSSDKMSETEKRDVLKGIVRDLVSDLFTDTTSGMNTGLRLNKHCKEIISAYLDASKNASGWHSKMLTVANGKEDFYAHSTNSMVVSTLIAIGIGLEEKNIDALAVASLLHQIGLSRLPEELQQKTASTVSEEQKKAFFNHSNLAVEILKEKKVVLPELAYKVILQQNEKFDGTGYPSALTGRQVCTEAQILYLVNTLLYRIGLDENRNKNLLVVFDEYRAEYNANPANRAIAPEIFTKISSVFTTGKPIEDEGVSSPKWKMS